jgi:regulator of sigma E protease
VAKDSPAEVAGLNPGDVIKGFEGDIAYEVDTVAEVQTYVLENQGKEVLILIERGQKEVSLPVNLRENPPEGEGILGISLARTADRSYPFYKAPLMGIKATLYLTGRVVTGWAGVVGSLFSGQGLPSGVSFVGPIGIGSMLNDAAKIGVSYFLQFIAMLAVYMAVFNILPIPALDGGRLLFLLIEKLRGRPLNKKIEQNFNGVVFIILLILMALVTIKDVTNLF